MQIWNDSNYLQIDGESQHVVLIRKGTVTTTALNTGGMVPTSAVTIAVNPGEFLALSSPSAPFCVAGKYKGYWTLHVLGGADSVINYWVFGPYTPSGIRVGMAVFGSDGQMIYDTGRFPLRVAGEVQGLGDFSGWPPDRTLALVPWMQYCELFRVVYSDPEPGADTVLGIGLFTTTGFARPVGNGVIHVENTEYQRFVSGPIPKTAVPPGWEGTWSNNLQNKYSVIDVTGL
ncbi:hypothetical protein PIN31115_02590 [Pandoraea iniqua]|uniref:Uncharacterized protein n=1 Tax=Pandoraea iniqua TaxID=2508288 RepID=A0A5E4VDU1_9BURK|nr:hypothetical protein [Pandoraea iniqua]VVE10467.1 hypothetical protein PIN31115_02590 [Pandoraea iniqua]